MAEKTEARMFDHESMKNREHAFNGERHSQYSYLVQIYVDIQSHTHFNTNSD